MITFMALIIAATAIAFTVERVAIRIRDIRSWH